MAGTFIDMVNRITTELRRSNATADVKQAINDAIKEAAQNSFYFNRYSVNITTVPGQFGSYEQAGASGMTEIDQAFWLPDFPSQNRYELLDVINTDQYDHLSESNRSSGSAQPEAITRDSYGFIIYPLPTAVTTVSVNGYGTLIPYPLVNDADTNAWMTEGEQYIRALAKRNYLRDIVRDYGEARVYDAVADGYLAQLTEKSAVKQSTGRIKATRF